LHFYRYFFISMPAKGSRKRSATSSRSKSAEQEQAPPLNPDHDSSESDLEASPAMPARKRLKRIMADESDSSSDDESEGHPTPRVCSNSKIRPLSVKLLINM
jgi:hypothetical protein